MVISIPSLRRAAAQTKTPALAIIAILGVTYLVYKIVISIHDDSVGNGLDFRYVWLAGKIWGLGQNPYGPLFVKEYHENFHSVVSIGSWVYPPYWFPIAVSFGSLSFDLANILWKLSNLLLLIGATHLVARALADVSHEDYWPIFLGGVGFACFMQAIVFTLFFGQTSIFAYFGLAGIIFGILKARPLFMVIGLVSLALKPQIGIIAFVGILAHRRDRWTILPAGIICLAATAPVAASGYSATLEAFFSNLREYNSIPVNEPASMTGLINILDYFHINFRAFTLLFVSTAAIFAGIAFHDISSRRTKSNIEATHCQIVSLAQFVACLFFILPLHSYDLGALASLTMMTTATLFEGRYLIAFGLLICFRPRNLFDLLGASNSNILDFPESRIASAGLLLIFIGVLLTMLRERMKTRGTTCAT